MPETPEQPEMLSMGISKLIGQTVRQVLDTTDVEHLITKNQVGKLAEQLELALSVKLNGLVTIPGTPHQVIFDGPPSAISGRFVELEHLDGTACQGEWQPEGHPGYWKLMVSGTCEAQDKLGEK